MLSLLDRTYAGLQSIVQGLRTSWSSEERGEADPEAVLLLFVNAIGDFVLFSSILPALAHRYAGHKITLAGYDRFAPLIPGIASIDQYIPIQRKRVNRNPFYRYRLLGQLRRIRYQVALYPSYSRTELGDDLMRLIRADGKIAYDGDTNNISPRTMGRNRRIYTRLIPSSGVDVSEIERFHHLARELGADHSELGWPALAAGDTERESVGRLLKSKGIDNGQPYALIGPGAASPLRVWSPEGYNAVCTWLHEHGFACVLSGSDKDRELIGAITMSTPAPVIDLAGQTTLPQLVALCAGAVLFVGSESGPLHIAAATGIPTLGIVGGGHPFRFYPWGDRASHRIVNKTMDCYGCNWHCIYDQARCITQIEPSAVLMELADLIDITISPQGVNES